MAKRPVMAGVALATQAGLPVGGTIVDSAPAVATAPRPATAAAASAPARPGASVQSVVQDAMSNLTRNLPTEPPADAAPAPSVAATAQPAAPSEPPVDVVPPTPPATVDTTQLTPPPVVEHPGGVATTEQVVLPDNIPAVEALPGLPTDVLAAEPVTAAPGTPTSVDTIAAPADTASNQKSAHAWAQLRHAAKSWETMAAELQTRIATLESERQTLQARATEEQQLRQQLEARVEQVALAESRPFKEKYDKALAQIEARVVGTLVKAGRKQEDSQVLARKILAAEPAVFAELTADLPTYIQGALFNSLSDYTAAYEARAGALQNWQETRAAQETEAARNSVVRRGAAVDQAVTKAVQEAAKAGNIMYRPSTDPNWTRQVNHRVEALKGICKAAKSDTDLLRYAADGISLPAYMQMLNQQGQRIRSLETQIMELTGVTPPVTPVTPPVASGAPAPAARPAAVRPIDAAAKLFGNLRRPVAR